MKKCRLGDISWCQTGPFGSQLHEEDYVEFGTPIITVEHLGDTGFTSQNLPFVSKQDAIRLSKYTLLEGDIVFSRVGSVDRSTYVRKSEEGWLFSGRCLRIRCKNEKVNPRYLSYYFKLNNFKQMMKNNAVGATMPSLNTDIMNNTILHLLEREHQDRIADFFDAIDSKIENNNRIITELESMAKLIYNYWFVQFDFPDENGRPYKSSGGKMVWNDELKREIPEGWEVKSFAKIVLSIKTGLNPRKNFKLNTGSIKYVTVKNLNENGVLDFKGCDTIDSTARDIIHQRSDVSKGDILFASIAPLGRCYIVQQTPHEWEINESVFSIRPNQECSNASFVYMILTDTNFIKKATSCSSGSVFQGIRIKELFNLPVVIPKPNIMGKFEKILNPIFLLKHNAINENQQLASLRDFLLPLLMNGQVTIGENAGEIKEEN